MEVHKISILWEPAPVPETGLIWDAVNAWGELWSKGALVANLGGPVRVMIGAGPEAKDPLEVDIWGPHEWALREPVEADTLLLNLMALGMPEYQQLEHTIVVDGQKTVVQLPRWHGTATYEIELKAGLPLPLIIGGLAIAGVGIIAVATKKR